MATRYMGESGIHIGGGTPNAWGAGGSSANAPDWVRRAHRMGMQDRAAGLGEARSPAAQVGEGLRQIRPWTKQSSANGAGFAADFQRRQQEEDGRRESLRLGAGAQSAMRSAATGAQKVEADGRVHINVQTRDPGTRVSHSASGNLFREIVQSRGMQMAPAGDG